MLFRSEKLGVAVPQPSPVRCTLCVRIHPNYALRSAEWSLSGARQTVRKRSGTDYFAVL